MLRHEDIEYTISSYGCEWNSSLSRAEKTTIQRIKRLSKKHQRQCENACNGVGVVNGEVYYLGKIDDYAKREYGQGVKDGHISDDFSVFDKEIQRLQRKIWLLIDKTLFTAKFQHDPRGYTVKLFYDGDFIVW